jgi:DNA-binding LacI/PurR family transcriptional regulator
MAVTMRDVAARAGVSIATVSFVVNESKPVKEPTRLRIEQAMAELGFQRNMVACALASRQTRIIALAYPALDHRLGWSIVDFVTSAAQAASDAGYHLVLWPVSNDATELAELVGQGLVDGVLLMHVQLDDARVEVLRPMDIPFALIGRTRDVEGLAHVDIDFDASLRVAVDHLTALGHREIVLVTGTQETQNFREYGPYVRLEAAFAQVTGGPVLRCRQDPGSGRELASRLAVEAPTATAVIVADEAISAGLVAGLHTRGTRIPTDMSVLCILTSRDMAAMCDPPLTIVTAPGVELGRLGVEALLCRVQGATPPPPVLRAGELLPGESTGPVPA